MNAPAANGIRLQKVLAAAIRSMMTNAAWVFRLSAKASTIASWGRRRRAAAKSQYRSAKAT